MTEGIVTTEGTTPQSEPGTPTVDEWDPRRDAANRPSQDLHFGHWHGTSRVANWLCRRTDR